MDYKEIERIFYRDGYRLAHQYLEEEVSAQNLTAGIRQLYDSVDELLDSFLQRSAMEGRPAECKKGCSWCCHQVVYGVTHEFLYLRDHIEKHFKEETRNKFLEKARESVLLTLQKSHQERLQVKVPCPFLDSGSCSVHAVRPMACRIYLSSSENACKKEHDETVTGNDFPDLFEFPLRAGRMLNQGFVAYLKQIGFQVSEAPLDQGYSSLVTLGQTMEGWIEGRSFSS
ncbi:MAG: YkgJ family cysteine cluster protein [Bacteroidota bacterium]